MKRREKRFLLLKEKYEKTSRIDASISAGLSSSQVNDREENSLINKNVNKTDKSVGQIIAKNLFTFFNILLFAIAIILFWFGLFNQTTFLLAVLLNTAIGIFQEIKAKRTLEKMHLLDENTIKVIRDSKQVEIKSDSLVLDDVYTLSSGDQIPTDSILLSKQASVNESLLTGESKSVIKNKGDMLLAGSFISSGSCLLKVERIGDLNYIHSIQDKATAMKDNKSDLVKAMNKILKVITFIIVPLGIMLFISQYKTIEMQNIGMTNHLITKNAFSLTAGSLVGMIPMGMYLLITIALSKSVITLVKKKTLVNDLYSVERLARVDTLCLDKTGTLTDGSMRVDEVKLFDKSYDIERLMASYLSAFEDKNQTSIALLKRFNKEKSYQVSSFVPFSSDKKCSSVTFNSLGTFYLGAPEYVLKEIPIKLQEEIKKRQERGNRVLLLSKDDGENRSTICMITLIDHIREEAKDTIKWFIDNKVDIKIISGDDPKTCSYIADRCGIKNAERYVSLANKSDEEVISLLDEYTVFGRVTPEQKALIVKALKDKGRRVGMTGDGVNDILAMKNSDCSIAMANGSKACKSVAHIVLLDSNFASMPLAVSEGRKCVNNVSKSSSLYLMKTIFTMALTFSILVASLINISQGKSGVQYPFKPHNLIILSGFAIGLSSLFLALGKDDKPIVNNFVKKTFIRALPSSLLMLITIGINYLMAFRFTSSFFSYDSQEVTRSFLSMNALSVITVSLAMSFNSFLPFKPIKENYPKLIMFLIVLALSTLSLFISPYVPFVKDDNVSKFLFGFDFRYLSKNMSYILIAYAILSPIILYFLLKISDKICDKSKVKK